MTTHEEVETINTTQIINPLQNTGYNLLIIKTWQSITLIKEKFFPHHEVLLTPFLNKKGEKRQLTLCLAAQDILTTFQQKVEKITWIESAEQFSWNKIVYPQENEEDSLFLILNHKVEEKDLLSLLEKIEEVLQKFVTLQLIPAYSWKIRTKELPFLTEESEAPKECFFYLKFNNVPTTIIAIIKIYLHNRQIFFNRKFLHLKCFWMKKKK